MWLVVDNFIILPAEAVTMPLLGSTKSASN
jgi:hypothetical protein